MDAEGHATKVKAVIPDPALGKVGFFLEGENYVAFDLFIMTKN